MALSYSSCKKTKADDQESPFKNYTKAAVTNVSIMNMPFVNSAGLPWDSLDGPDLVFSISQNDNFLTAGYFSFFDKKNITPADLPLSGYMPLPKKN